MAEYTQKQNTSTQIRNFYSEGISYINIKFYNTNLSFSFHKFLTKDSIGRSTYDNQNSLMTTVNWEGAFALYQLANEIIEGKSTNPCSIIIPCASDAQLILERRPIPMMNNANPMMETIFSIKKNNEIIPFKFKTQQVQYIENGQPVIKIIESGLGAFMKTIDGYLEGINADRHLDKLTETYIKSQETNSNNQYTGNSGYQKKPWQKKQYNSNNQNFNSTANTPQPWETQNMSSYQLPN